MSVISKLTAQLEVRVLEFNAIVKLIRSRKFRNFHLIDLDMHMMRLDVYEERQHALLNEIEAIKATLGGNVNLWEGIF
jgi:hypothetical protein